MPRDETLEMTDFQSLDLSGGSSAQLALNPSVTEASSFRSVPPKQDAEVVELLEHYGSKHDSQAFAGFSKTTKRKNITKALWHFSWIHLPSVAITSTLLSLYIKELRWDNPSIEALNGLQFAAKAHEGLILLSLGDILLHRMSWSLGYHDIGVPIGLLPSAFYLGSPYAYLSSRQLWAPILRSYNKSKAHVTTGALIVLAIFVSVAASPLSAVAMLPRQSWWGKGSVDWFHPDLYDQIPHIAYNTKMDLEMARFLGEGKFPTTEIMPMFLPSGESQTFSISRELLLRNMSFSNYEAYSRPISVGTIGSEEHGIAFATCPTADMAASLSGIEPDGTVPISFASERIANGSTKAEKWKQPLVAVECSTNFLKNGTAEFLFNSRLGNRTISLSTNKSSVLHQLDKNIKYDKLSAGHGYTNLRKSMDLPVSADILFSFFDPSLDDSSIPWMTAQYNLCFILAWWVQVDTWIEPAKSRDVTMRLPFPLEEAPERISDAFNTSDFIHIDNEWMEQIASLSDFPDSSTSPSFFDKMMKYCGNIIESNNPYCMAQLLALEVIDAISMTSDYGKPGWEFDTIYLMKYVYTYAYSFHSSLGVPLAFSVFLLHFALVLVHLMIILVSKNPWRGSEWNSFGDLLVLALRSKTSDEINGITGRDSKSKVWTFSATVEREKDDSWQQIVLKDI